MLIGAIVQLNEHYYTTSYHFLVDIYIHALISVLIPVSKKAMADWSGETESSFR